MPTNTRRRCADSLRRTDAHARAADRSINDGEEFSVEYEIVPHTLGIGNEPFLKPSGDGPHLVLEVDDFDTAIEHLRRYELLFV